MPIMRRSGPAILTILLTGFVVCGSVSAAETVLTPKPIQTDTLDTLRWNARPIVVLGEGGMVAAQMLALQDQWKALSERDVVVLTDGPGAGPLREKAGLGFAVLLIGKDGGVKLTRHDKVDPAEIIDLIDSMPMRQDEAQKTD